MLSTENEPTVALKKGVLCNKKFNSLKCEHLNNNKMFPLSLIMRMGGGLILFGSCAT
jgi:hypothetical protein